MNTKSVLTVLALSSVIVLGSDKAGHGRCLHAVRGALSLGASIIFDWAATC